MKFSKDKIKGFLSPKTGILNQIIKFCFVGGSAFLIDAGLLVLLKEVFFVDVLLAAAISYTISLLYNYYMSMRYVFLSREDGKMREFIIFVLLSVGGLIINEVILWLGVNIFFVHYMIVKIIATAVVLIYNFITRKLFLEKHAK